MLGNIVRVIGILGRYAKNLYLFEILFLCIYIYMFISGYIDYFLIIKCFFILVLLALYRFVLIHIINDSYLEESIQYEFKYKQKLFYFFDLKLLRSNLWLIKPIYYILYYFPTNWPYLFVIFISKKWAQLRLLVNSNKDIFGKIVLNKNLSITSPFNIKYIKFFKKYFVDIFLKLLFVFTFCKLNLISKEWKIFFKIKIFGSITTIVLITSNLHLITWFKTTTLVDLILKIFIVFVIMYFFLLFMYDIVDRKISFYYAQDYVTLTKYGQDTIVDDSIYYNIKCRSTFLNLGKLIKQPSISMFYKLKDYLIFMSLAQDYKSYIDFNYDRFLTKSIKLYNINMPSTLIMLGRISSNRFEIDKKDDFLKFFFLMKNIR